MPCRSVRINVLHGIRRYASTNSPFADTVLLPKTSFSGKVTANIVAQETSIQEKCDFHDLYQWQRTHNTGEEFILHDGPPYANGDVHVGHALNKVLKDITNRYKMMRGYRVHYAPGWDCHGLPIEMKSLSLNQNRVKSSQDIRKSAQDFARAAIERQKTAFQRWGVMANWSDNGCYYTFQRNFEATELQAFNDMYKNGLIYRDFKPVFWSPSSKTALAEAELEYNPQHQSRSIYFTCPVENSATSNRVFASHDLNLHILVWTTQPWTIPANRAVCFSSSQTYCIIKSNDHLDKLFIIAEASIDNVKAIFNSKIEVVCTFDGTELNGVRCSHPMDSDRICNLLPSNHVTSEKGTGFVHIAPAHGVEDFGIAMHHGLDVSSEVDDEGRFTDDAGFQLVGKYVFSEGNESVINYIRSKKNLIMEHLYTHSYPYDWRTKKPIFVKTSRQWFVDTESLKAKSHELISDVRIIPPSGRASMLSHLRGRTFWCISRQRAWGVPIPVFYHKHEAESLLSENGEMLITEDSVRHVISVIRKHGSDAWWSFPMSNLLPQEVIDSAGFSGSKPDDFETGKDILDIWFDSGLTWASVFGGIRDAPVADLYLEGKDQYGGWFQSSLLTSCALRDKAPYKSILVHGFVVSESGQKMSKSLGNVVDPMTVIDGGKNRNRDPPYGADVLRLWVAESNVYQEVMIGKNILESNKESLNKIRLSLRFLLGNLHDFVPNSLSVPFEQLRAVDKYLHTSLYKYATLVTTAYENFDYSRVIRIVLRFISKLSGFYFTVVKDRLYCDEKYGHPRISCLITLHNILDVILKSLSPILPHTVEEAALHYRYLGYSSVSRSSWCNLDVMESWRDAEIESLFDNVLVPMRQNFIEQLQGKPPYMYDIEIRTSDNATMEKLIDLSNTTSKGDFSELREIFGCSHCKVQSTRHADGQSVHNSDLSSGKAAGSFGIIIKEVEGRRCQRCRLYTASSATHPCDRCSNVIAGNWA